MVDENEGNYHFKSGKMNCYCRLQQNRKSAKKCRMKKKAEFSVMKNDVAALQEENKNLKDKVC